MELPSLWVKTNRLLIHTRELELFCQLGIQGFGALAFGVLGATKEKALTAWP